jgi:hypothetical protein
MDCHGVGGPRMDHHAGGRARMKCNVGVELEWIIILVV